MKDQTMTVKTKLTEEEAKEFHTMARTLLLAEGFLNALDESVHPWRDSLYLSYFEDWDTSLNDHTEVDAAIQDWVKYLQTAPALFETDSLRETLSVSRTHNLGAVSVTVGMSREFMVRSDIHRAGCYKLIDGALDAEVDRWVKRNAGKLGGSGASSSIPSGGLGGSLYKEEPAIVLVTEFTGGKHMHKVKTPLFAKWGVPLYPETLSEFGYSEDNLPPLGEVSLDGWLVKVMMKGDKPKKVVSARKID
jgi:hypothetical protein